jgi:hypothetical protein
MRKPRNSEVSRETFDQHVHRVPGSECWEWRWSGTPRGYGAVWSGGRQTYAHRKAYELFVGAIPDGMMVCHKCDNPKCCNPAHLFLGTQKDNMSDCVAKGRLTKGEHHGERNGRHKLTEDLVGWIRLFAKNGIPHRHIADLFGVTRSVVSHIKCGRSWRHSAGALA